MTGGERARRMLAGLLVLLALLATVLTLTLAGPSATTAVPEPDGMRCTEIPAGQVEVISTLTLEATPTHEMRATARYEARLPSSFAEVARYRGNDPRSSVARAAAQCLWPPFLLRAGERSVRIDGHRAIVTAAYSDVVGGGRRTVGLWDLRTGWSTVEIDHMEPGAYAGAFLLAGRPWDFELAVADARPHSVSPLPSTDDGRVLRWTSVPPAGVSSVDAARVHAAVDIPPLVALNSVGWRGYGPWLTLAVTDLVLLSPLLLVAGLLVLRPGAGGRRPGVVRVLLAPAAVVVAITARYADGLTVEPEASLAALLPLPLAWFGYAAVSGKWSPSRVFSSAALLWMAVLALVMRSLLSEGEQLSEQQVWLRLCLVFAGLLAIGAWAAVGTASWPLTVAARLGVPARPWWYAVARGLAALAFVALVVGLTATTATEWSRLADDLGMPLEVARAIPGRLFYFPISLAFGLRAVLPLVALVALAAWFWTRRNPPRLLLRRGAGLRLAAAALFAVFVVGLGGFHLHVQLPVAAAIALGVILRLTASRGPQQLEARLSRANRDVPKPVLISAQDELLQRGRDVERLRRRRRELYDKYAGDEEPPQDYWDKSRNLHARIVQGAPPRTGLTVPAGFPLLRGGLLPGPCRSWWGNAAVALRASAVAAVVPMVLYVAVLANSPPTGGISDTSLLQVLLGILSELAFWLAAGTVLGLLWPYLPVTTGVAKAAVLTAVYALTVGTDVLVGHALGEPGDTSWLFRVWQLLLFLSAVGFWLDLRTVTRDGTFWAHVLEHYQVRRLGGATAYAVPLLVAVIGVANQLRTGSGQEALLQLVNTFTSLVPSP